jgi:PAS domain S-box-containing protein
MKSAFSKFSIGTPDQLGSLRQLRERLLNRLAIFAIVIGTVLYATSLKPALERGLYSTIVIYSAIFIWLILISFVRRLPYWIRTGSWLILFYILGVINLNLSGFNVDAGLFFLTFIAMAALLIDLRGGLVVLVLSSITIAVMGFFTVTGRVPLRLGLPQVDPMLWIIGGTIFLLMGLLLIVSLTVLLGGLEANLMKAKKLAEELGRANKALRDSEEHYRTLVEISPDLVALIGLDGNINFFNQAGLALFGYKAMEEVIGKNILAFIASQDQARMAEGFQITLDTGGVKEVGCIVLKKDGTPCFAEFSFSLIVDMTGRPQAVIGVAKDISARKQAERLLLEAKDDLERKVVERTAELHRTSQRLRELVAYSPVVIYSARPSEDFGATFVTENVKTLLGYEAHQFIEEADFWSSHLHPEDAQRVSTEIKRVSEQRRVTCEYRFLHKDGDYRWLHDEMKLVRAANGSPVELIGSWVDITELKLAGDARRESEESIRVVFEATSASALLIDAVGTILAINNVAAKRIGKTVSEIKGACLYDLFPSRVGRAKRALFGEVIRSGKAIRQEDNIRGSLYENVIYPIFDEQRRVTKCVLFAVDITERRRVEQMLHESEEKYQSLVERAYDGITIIQDGIVKFANPRLAELRGEPLNKIIGSRFEEYIHPDERQKVLEYYTRRMAGEKVPTSYEATLVRKDKSKVNVELSTGIIQYGGRPADFVVVHDVTERRQVEEALRASEERYRTLAEAAQDFIFIINADDRIEYVNSSAARQFGKRPEEIVGKLRSKLFPAQTSENQKCNLQKVVEKGAPLYFEDITKFLGHALWLGTWLVPLKTSNGVVCSILGVSRDISERKLMEQSLQQAKELLEKRVAERTAELIASHERTRDLARQVISAQEEERRRVSRELHDEAGQELIALKFNLDEIRTDLPDGLSPIRERLSQAINDTNQAMEHIRDLAHSLHPPVMDVGGINLGLDDFCREFSNRFHLSVDYRGTDLPNVPDESSITLYRVLQEMVTNVVRHARAKRIWVTLRYKNETIILSVKDNGQGFKQESTKRGIGLTGIEERLHLLGGRFEVKSRPGNGTRMTAYVPWQRDQEP